MARSGMPTAVKVILIVLGVGLVLGIGCCALGGFWGVRTANEFATMTQTEREREIAGFLRNVVGDGDAPALQFIEHVRQDRLDEAFAMTTPEFRAVSDREAFGRTQAHVDDVMGELIETRLQEFNKSARVGTGGSGTSIAISYGATFERGEGTIKLMLHRPVGSEPLIAGYRVESPLFDAAPGAGPSGTLPEPQIRPKLLPETLPEPAPESDER